MNTIITNSIVNCKQFSTNSGRISTRNTKIDKIVSTTHINLAKIKYRISTRLTGPSKAAKLILKIFIINTKYRQNKANAIKQEATNLISSWNSQNLLKNSFIINLNWLTTLIV